jgi:hypothetical protein
MSESLSTNDIDIELELGLKSDGCAERNSVTLVWGSWLNVFLTDSVYVICRLATKTICESLRAVFTGCLDECIHQFIQVRGYPAP